MVAGSAWSISSVEAVGAEPQQIDATAPVDDDGLLSAIAFVWPPCVQVPPSWYAGKLAKVVVGAVSRGCFESRQVCQFTRGEVEQLLRVYISDELGHRRHDARCVFRSLRAVVDDGPVSRGRGVGSGVGPPVGDRQVDGRRAGITAVDRSLGDVVLVGYSWRWWG